MRVLELSETERGNSPILSFELHAVGDGSKHGEIDVSFQDRFNILSLMKMIGDGMQQLESDSRPGEIPVRISG